MLALLQNEYTKVFSRRSFKIACILFIILAALLIVIPQGTGDEQFEYIIINAIIQAVLSFSGLYIIFVANNLLLADEFKTGTINLIATCPLQRWKILLSKYITILSIFVISTLLITTILSFSDTPAWQMQLGSLLKNILFYMPLTFLLSVLFKSSKVLTYVIGYEFLNGYLIATGIFNKYIFLKYSFGVCINGLIDKLMPSPEAVANGIPNHMDIAYEMNTLTIICVIYLIILTLIPFIILQKRDLT